MKFKNLKIIHISSASSSCSVKDYEEDIYEGAWSSKIVYQIKKLYSKENIEIECWAIEKKYKEEKEKIYKNLKFRIFPTNFSIRHAKEISMSLIKALIKEQNTAKKEKKQLIIHLHEHHTWESYLILLFLKDNVRIISQHHGARSPFQNLKKYKWMILLLPLLGFMQILERILFKKIKIFYVGTKEEMGYIKKIAPNSLVRFQTMGIDEEYFKKIGKSHAKKKLGLKDKKYFLFLGRIKTTKGISELLTAMKKFKKEDVELLLIGGGKDYDKYKKYGIKNKVTFLGPIYGKEKLLYLSAVDYLILPSYTETCPVVVKEAIAKNLPVIVSNVGGVSTMIENGREGIIIKPKSSLEIIKAMKEILTWKRKKIQKYGKKYKWRYIIYQTIKDYFRR